MLPEERTRAYWLGHLTKARQLAGFCQLVRSCLERPLLPGPPAACLAPWNEHCLAYPCSHWLFWGPPSSNEERDAEHPSACSLRWDLFLQEGGLGRLPLPTLSAKAPEPGISAEDSRYPSGLV